VQRRGQPAPFPQDIHAGKQDTIQPEGTTKAEEFPFCDGPAKTINLCFVRRAALTIAKQCGFASSQDFTRVFHHRIGRTPAEYRKRGAKAQPEVLPR
jgi:AraC-like DNA-binding protein